MRYLLSDATHCIGQKASVSGSIFISSFSFSDKLDRHVSLQTFFSIDVFRCKIVPGSVSFDLHKYIRLLRKRIEVKISGETVSFQIDSRR